MWDYVTGRPWNNGDATKWMRVEYMYIYMYIYCVYVCMYVRVPVCVRVYVHVHIYVLSECKATFYYMGAYILKT